MTVTMRLPEAIILAGGEDSRLNPLTSAEQPKCLLPVANLPAIQYSLTVLRKAGITSVFVARPLLTRRKGACAYAEHPAASSDVSTVLLRPGGCCACRNAQHTAPRHPNSDCSPQVVCGESIASKVQKHFSKEASLSELTIKVVTAASQSGSADAVRMVASKLTGDTVVVMSGDTVTDLALTSVLFTHRIRNAGITTVLAKSAASASENTKLGKAPKACTRHPRLLTSCMPCALSKSPAEQLRRGI